MRVVFTAFGDKQIDRRLMRLGERVIDPRPIYRFMMAAFYDWEKELFNTEGESGGERWAPLADSTLRDKAKHGKPLSILQEDRYLYRSLTSPRARGSYARFSRYGMEVGSSLKYAAIHYHGSPKTNLPRRRPVMLTQPQRQEWVKMMQRWIMT